MRRQPDNATHRPKRPAGTGLRVRPMSAELRTAGGPPECSQARWAAGEWRDSWPLHLAIIALALVLGLGYAYIVVGARVLNPLNTSWLAADPATAYLGWAFFRQEA